LPRLSLFSPAVAASLSPRTVRALSAHFALVDVAEHERLTLARTFFARVLADDLALALDDIERLATALGWEAILEAARARGSDRVDDYAARAPADLAARLVLAALEAGERGAEARAILARARVRVGRYFSPRASYELALHGEIDVDAVVGAGRRVHGASVVDAWAAAHDGVTHVAVLHAGPPSGDVFVQEGAIVRRARRPLAFDRARIDLRRKRVGLSLARPSLLPDWIAALDASTQGRAELQPRPAFSLRLLHEAGAAWLEGKRLPAPIRRVTAVGCELDDGTRTSVRSPAALADLHDRLGARGGYLVRVTLRFEMTGGETADATIELPRKLTIPDARFEEPIRDALDALRLTTPGALPDDLSSLAPFEHAAWRWIEVVRVPGCDAAVASGLLVRAHASRRVADPAARAYGSSLIAHDLPGEETKYALAEDLSVRAHDVPPEACVRWRLDPARLARSVAARLHLAPMPKPKRPLPEGLLPIGVLEVGDFKACIFQLMRLVRDAEQGDVREGLRLACAPAHPLVLVGPGRTLGKGVAEVEVDPARLFTGEDLPDVLSEIVAALGVEDDVPGWMFATASRPLVVMTARGEIWYERVRLDVTPNQAAMIIGLARTPGEWVTAAELGARISPNAGIVDQIARKTRAGFDERVAESFKRAGVKMAARLGERIVEVDKGRGCYRIGVGVVVR
jgi:hypothetical protein